MFLKKRLTYCSVSFGDDRSYWYRTNEYGFRAGDKVIVPVSNNGLWKIGTILNVKRCYTDEAPYPPNRTKGIVEKAGLLSSGKVDKHNLQINNAEYPPMDISISSIDTPAGRVTYCTCARERNILRKKMERYKGKYVLIENYPVAQESEIPIEALNRLNKR